jgi:hypothetical protein
LNHCGDHPTDGFGVHKFEQRNDAIQSRTIDRIDPIRVPLTGVRISEGAVNSSFWSGSSYSIPVYGLCQSSCDAFFAGNLLDGSGYFIQAVAEVFSLGGMALYSNSIRFAKSAMNAAKGSAQGGLNLFKSGAEQTGKSTGWKAGDYMLHLPNKGTPKLNWKANYGALRYEMNLGKPIFDSYRLPNGNLIPTGGFLNAERFTLQTRGWIYNPSLGAWIPPY